MKQFKAGEIIAVRRSAREGHYPALVVDQIAGKVWADVDPYFGYVPEPGEMDECIFVRVLGLRITELPGTRSALPEFEPCRTEIVRWTFIQQDNAFHLAGPDVESIEIFFEGLRLGIQIGMIDESGFISDLEAIVQYLHLSRLKSHGRVEPAVKGSFLSMLEEVLPQ